MSRKMSTPHRSAPQAGVDGNWSCHHCYNVNFPLRHSCNRCKLPRAKYIPQSRSTYPSSSSSHYSHSSGSSHHNHNRHNHNHNHNHNNNNSHHHSQSRSHSHNHNHSQSQSSNRNHSHDHSHSRPHSRGSYSEHGHRTHGASQSGFINATQHHSPNQGAPHVSHHGSQNGNWVCGKCRNINFSYRSKCNRCDNDRPSYADQLKVDAAVKFLTHFDTYDQAMAFFVELDPKLMKEQKLAPGTGQFIDGLTRRKKKNRSFPPKDGEQGNWKCSSESCSNINFPKRSSCNLCGLHRTAEQELSALAFLDLEASANITSPLTSTPPPHQQSSSNNSTPPNGVVSTSTASTTSTPPSTGNTTPISTTSPSGTP